MASSVIKLSNAIEKMQNYLEIISRSGEMLSKRQTTMKPPKYMGHQNVSNGKLPNLIALSNGEHITWHKGDDRMVSIDTVSLLPIQKKSGQYYNFLTRNLIADLIDFSVFENGVVFNKQTNTFLDISVFDPNTFQKQNTPDVEYAGDTPRLILFLSRDGSLLITVDKNRPKSAFDANPSYAVSSSRGLRLKTVCFSPYHAIFVNDDNNKYDLYRLTYDVEAGIKLTNISFRKINDLTVAQQEMLIDRDHFDLPKYLFSGQVFVRQRLREYSILIFNGDEAVELLRTIPAESMYSDIKYLSKDTLWVAHSNYSYRYKTKELL